MDKANSAEGEVIKEMIITVLVTFMITFYLTGKADMELVENKVKAGLIPVIINDEILWIAK